MAVRSEGVTGDIIGGEADGQEVGRLIRTEALRFDGRLRELQLVFGRPGSADKGGVEGRSRFSQAACEPAREGAAQAQHVRLPERVVRAIIRVVTG